MRFLGFLFVAFLISTGILYLDYTLPGNFLNVFLSDHFISVYAILIGFNISSVTFLMGHLISIQLRFKSNFTNSINEIRDNVYFLLGLFLVSLLLLIVRPPINKDDFSLYANPVYYILNMLVLSAFILSITSIFEILKATFKVSGSIPIDSVE